MVTGVSSIPLTPHAFIVGSENRILEMALVLLRSKIGSLGDGATGTDLLVLCGPSGSGKTHLARGILDAYVGWASSPSPSSDSKSHGLGSPSCYLLDAESLRRALADHRQPARLAAWRRQLRQAELLVFDGVDDLAGHASGQQELAATIDALQSEGERLIVTSRTPPSATPALDARLRSRLQAGLVINIAPPQRPTRLALLTAFAQQQQIQLDTRTTSALADAPLCTAGELLAALVQVSQQVDPSMSAADLREMLSPTGAGRRPRIATITTKVARHYGLTLADLRGRSRRRSVATARAMAMYLCRQLAGSHLHQIGKYLGGRDHTTVLHGCQKIEQLLKEDATTRAEFAQLSRDLSTNKNQHRARRE